MTNFEQHRQTWESLYQDGKTGWDRGQISPALTHWLGSDVWPENASVIIPGAGRGYEAVELARLGFQVTAIDVADSALHDLQALAEQAGVTVTTVHADVLQWQPEQPVDVIYEQTCLCALNPELWADYVKALHTWLKPEGYLFAQFMQTHSEGGPPYHCDLSAMQALFSNADWQWLTEEGVKFAHHNQFHELAFALVKR